MQNIFNKTEQACSSEGKATKHKEATCRHHQIMSGCDVKDTALLGGILKLAAVLPIKACTILNVYENAHEIIFYRPAQIPMSVTYYRSKKHGGLAISHYNN